MHFELSPRQKKFADLYLEYGNQTKAVTEAGYKGGIVTANKLLKNPKVREYIDSRLEEIKSQRIADIQEVMEYLTKGLRQELEEEVVVVEGIEKGVSEAKIMIKKIGLKESNKCAEMLAKRFGILTDNIDVSVSVPVIGGEDNLED